ncbi:MAG: tripartite tricarboxylate transporter substrate binding protein [Pseudomonadota bacterium]
MKFRFRACIFLLAVLAAPFASSQTEKITRIVVPYTAGGGVDSLARALTRSLQSSLGNTVIVENKPGAGGNIAMDYVAAAPADGNILVLATNNLTINPVLYESVKFSADKSFSPVSLMAESPVLFVTKVGSSFKDMKDVIAFAKANPGKLSYASCGNGNIHHFAGELLKSMARVSIVHIPYRGCSSAVTDVVSGQVDLGVISLTAVGPFISSNRVKGLAVTSGQRSKLLPDMPTVSEATGLRNYALTGWYAMLAPAKTPRAVVERLNAAIEKALTDKEVMANLTTAQLEPIGGPPERLAKFIQEDDARVRAVAKEGGIKGD